MKLPFDQFTGSTASSSSRDPIAAQVGAAVVAAAQMLAHDPHPEAGYAELLTASWSVAGDEDGIASRNKKRAAVAFGRARKGLPITAGYQPFNPSDPRDIARAVKNKLREERRRKAGGRHRGWTAQHIAYVDGAGYCGDGYVDAEIDAGADAGEIEIDADGMDEEQEAREVSAEIDAAFGREPRRAR